MAIHKLKRGSKTYLSEYKKVREGKRVKSVFVRYLGSEDGVKAGRKPTRVLDKIRMSRSHRSGDVRLLWEIAQDLDFINVIDRICCQQSCINGPSPGKFLTAWAVNRAIDPESCTQLERWIPTTDLPLLMGVDAKLFTKDAFLSSLDFVCRYDGRADHIVDHTEAINDALYMHRRSKYPLPAAEKETVAYDLTSVLFFGTTCPLAEFGFNAKNAKRLQTNLALIVSKYDKYPISHYVYNGGRNACSTVKNLIAHLKDSPLRPGTIIWDRGNVSKDHVETITAAGWKLICGVPKTSKEAREISGTDVPMDPTTFVRRTKSNNVYAIKSGKQLFGLESVIVYVDPERRTRKINEQNMALAGIGEKLDSLNKQWPEAKLHKAIKSIVDDWKDCIAVRVKRKGSPRIEWRYRKQKIAAKERLYGKYLLLSTDESLSVGGALASYFEKDFVEKVFRTLGTYEKIEPVRHRLEPRVRAYLFICVMAYRLLAALHFRFEQAKKDNDKTSAWEKTYDLLHKLARVERVEVGFGKDVRTWHLNLTNDAKDSLKSIGMKNLLEGGARTDL